MLRRTLSLRAPLPPAPPDLPQDPARKRRPSGSVEASRNYSGRLGSLTIKPGHRGRAGSTHTKCGGDQKRDKAVRSLLEGDRRTDRGEGRGWYGSGKTHRTSLSLSHSLHPGSHRFNRSLPKQAKAKSMLSSLRCAGAVFACPASVFHLVMAPVFQ